MKEQKPTPKRRKPTKPTKPAEQELVKGASLTAFINNKLNDVAAACKQVANDKKDVSDSELHCQYYLDGAKEVARQILELVPPVLASDLIKTIAGTVNGIATHVPQIAKDCKIDEGFVLSYASGARAFGDIVVKGLKDAPRTDAAGNEVPQADGGEKHDN